MVMAYWRFVDFNESASIRGRDKKLEEVIFPTNCPLLKYSSKIIWFDGTDWENKIIGIVQKTQKRKMEDAFILSMKNKELKSDLTLIFNSITKSFPENGKKDVFDVN